MTDKKCNQPDYEGFTEAVRKVLGSLFEKYRFHQNVPSTDVRPLIEDELERYGIRKDYYYRAVFFAFECIIADGLGPSGTPVKIAIEKDAAGKVVSSQNVYLRLFSHTGGGGSFCFTDTNDREKRFAHFQGK